MENLKNLSYFEIYALWDVIIFQELVLEMYSYIIVFLIYIFFAEYKYEEKKIVYVLIPLIYYLHLYHLDIMLVVTEVT